MRTNASRELVLIERGQMLPVTVFQIHYISPQLAHQLRATNLNNNNHSAQCPHVLHSVYPFSTLDSPTTRRPFSIEGVKQIKTLSNVLSVGITPRLGKQSPGV